ncbi:MAG: glycoside hydrolase family 31 protein [Verrucomicrobiota bacterium JB022]|nr:glycoside hydrolase family 31 protein [Verrucomicrobiota bacterium JB022]
MNTLPFSRRETSLLCLLGLLIFVAARAQAYVERATGFSGLVGDRIALFLPADLPIEQMPPSLALLERPEPKGALPEGWQVQPQFFLGDERTRVTIEVPPGTSLYGTGEVTGPLERSGQNVTLWNRDNYGYRDNGGHQLYQSHPWVLAVRPDGTAFGMLADTTWRSEIALDGKIEFTSEGPWFPVIVIERESPQEVVSALADLTGHMPLPPRWALGYQQSRWSYYPDTRVREIADELRQRRLPTDVIWMDIDYMDGFRVFTFDPTGFPEPHAVNRYLHEHNFKAVWMIDPGIKVDPDYFIYEAGTEGDMWVQDAFGQPFVGDVWPGPCVFPDYTRPEVREWWADLYGDFMATGIDGVWNDMNEPAVANVPSKTMPPHNWHRGGGDLPAGPHARYHNVYGMLMVQATREGILDAKPDKRPFVLTRANFLGGHRYAATWTGDNLSTWEHLKWSIPMTLNLGLSGQPFNGPDIGGFGGDAEADLYANWIAVGSLFPFARGHATKDSNAKEPWAFGEEVEGVARTALERRYRLLPYLYTLFEQSARNGLPVMRPTFFADPTNAELRGEDETFLLGDDLLVVPVWASAPAPLPGTWRPISLVGEPATGDPYQPVLKLRGGAILPLGRVVQSTVEDSLQPLTLVVSLNEYGKAQGTLYEDAGDGFGYRNGDFLRTTYRAERRGQEVHVTVAATEGDRARPRRPVVVELVTDHGVTRAEGIDGQPVVIPLRN